MRRAVVRRILFRGVSRGLLHPWFRWQRGLTLGVRCLAIDADGRVLLVRHSYAPGWLLPGGGVERGETAYDALVREIREEAGLVAEERPHLHGLFSNEDHFAGDHVACFVLRRFRRDAWSPSLEIVAAEFHAPSELPPGTTGGTRRRIDEVFSGRAPEPNW